MKTVIVDWLGRGGIAQTTVAWARELGAAGHDVVVVTRPGRDLPGSGFTVVEAPAHRGRIRGHRAVASVAGQVIGQQRPDTVLIQNYVLPPLERPPYEAARNVGARLLAVVHDHRLHSLAAGTGFGLRAHLRLADAVLAHTPFVAEAVRAVTGRPVEVLPLPAPVALLEHATATDARFAAGDQLLAVHFGVLKRGYKGTDTILELARRGVPGWRFAVLGNGAPQAAPGVVTVPGFVDGAVLVDAVQASAATLLPYRIASQSAAVVLAQAVGSVAVATAVGGIPSQITDGITGRLLRPGASIEAWAAVLAELADADARRPLADAARAKVADDHRAFGDRARGLVQ
jgi:glycosyltransferase involved in cell wall biosynthesis